MKRVLQTSPNVRLTLIATICFLVFLAIVAVRGIGLASAADPGLTPQTLEVIPYGATAYRFNTYGPGAVPPGYGLETFDDSAFAAGDASFGSGGGCPLQSTVKTNWPVDSEIVLRRSFDLPPGAFNLRVMVAIDNDVDVFLNGEDISGGLVQHENCPALDEFMFNAPDIILKTQNNVLAVRGVDRGVESCLDLRVLVEVPEPTSTPTATDTFTPTATNTFTPTPTLTPSPPTATFTAVPPTATSTSTSTPVPPTPTRTSTPVPSTATSTPTPRPHGVGGKVLLPPAAVADASSGTSGGSGQAVPMWIALAGVAGALGVVAGLRGYWLWSNRATDR